MFESFVISSIYVCDSTELSRTQAAAAAIVKSSLIHSTMMHLITMLNQLSSAAVLIWDNDASKVSKAVYLWLADWGLWGLLFYFRWWSAHVCTVCVPPTPSCMHIHTICQQAREELLI